MKFFKFTDGVIALDKDAIALYPNIKKILARDRGGKVVGDPDGRLKLHAFKEFAYVYHRCDFEAYPAQNGLNEKETHLYAAKMAELGKDYKPDELVEQFIKQYEKEHLTPSKSSIKTLIRVFSLTEKLIEKIEKNITDSLDLPVLNAAQITELLGYQKELIALTTAIPANVKKLKEAMGLLEEEDRMIRIARGGEEVLDSQDPGNSIEN